MGRSAILISLLLSLPCYGAHVEYVRKGTPAPYDGFLFDEEAERQAAQYRLDAKFYQDVADALTRKSKLQDEENKILEQRLQLYMNEANVLARNRVENETTQRLYMFGAFALGVITTTLVVRNVKP